MKYYVKQEKHKAVSNQYSLKATALTTLSKLSSIFCRTWWNHGETTKVPLPSPVKTIINQSLSTGIYPDKLKIARVIPLFKKDDISLMDNYRPKSLLASISKLVDLKIIVSNKVSEYFIKSTYSTMGNMALETTTPWNLQI